MSLPFFFEIGPIRLHPHAVFEFLAYVIGFQYYLRLRRRVVDPIDSGTRLRVLVGAAAGALVGSRLLGYGEHIQELLRAEGLLFVYMLFSTKTIVGGLLGGWIGVEVAKKLVGESRSTGDLYVRPLIIAMMIGRVGCFLSGIEDGTHGSVTSVSWAMDLGDGRPRHPAALYEIAFLFFLWLTTFALERTRTVKHRGNLFKFFLSAYLLFRLAAETWKPVVHLLGPFSAIQLACLAGLLYYALEAGGVFRSRPPGNKPGNHTIP